MPRQFDIRPTPVDRNPLWSLYDPGLSKLPKLTLDPEVMWEAFVNGVKQLTGIDLSSPQALVESLGDALAAAPEHIIRAVAGVLGFAAAPTAAIGVVRDWLQQNLLGPVQAWRLPPIHIGRLFNDDGTALSLDPGFDIPPGDGEPGEWFWDTENGRGDAPGCSAIVGNGQYAELIGQPVAVAAGQSINPSVYVDWDGDTDISPGSAPARLLVVEFAGQQRVGEHVVGELAPTGASDWNHRIVGEAPYTVPDGVDMVALAVAVTEDLLAGTVRFDDSLDTPVGNILQEWITNLPQDLSDLRDRIEQALATFIEALQGVIPDLPGFGDLLDLVRDLLQRIPPLNILGVGGPQNIGASLQETWNQFVGGLVGQIGETAGLSDLFNIGREISSRASLGAFSWDVLGIRTNKGFDSGFLDSTEAPFALSSVAFASTAPTFTVSQSASTILFHRFNESGPFGVVSWQGQGNTNITAFHVNVWRMDTTDGSLELVHRSPNLLGDLSSTLAAHAYEFSDAGIEREPGDVFGAELEVVGTGTHEVVGQQTWLPDQLVFPRRWAATRNTGGNAPPSTIAGESVTYSPNTPFVEFGVAMAGVPIPHRPETTYFNQPGAQPTLPVPSWADVVDLIPVGAGGGGGGSVGALTGQGGEAGQFNPVSLVVGVDIKPGTVISVVVGAGGSGGIIGQSGSAGGNTTVTYIDMDDQEQTVTAAGGVGGGPGPVPAPGNDNNQFGSSPGSVTVDGIEYRGGGSAWSSLGAPPGGGGSGALPWLLGYEGAPGAAWIVTRQEAGSN